jgi:peroxiredoxin
MTTSFAELPADLPEPYDDGAASHLPRMQLPNVALAATSGGRVTLAHVPGLAIVYAYPRTGRPGEDLPEGWDAIPGARGCTPQSCAFRDHFEELRQLGVGNVFGLSTQDTEYQREMVERLHLPFAVLSDADLALTRALNLPTFQVGSMTLLKRLTLVLRDGVIEHVFYPVFPPDRSAAAVVEWLRARAA